jgi:hypothetical protein
MAGGPLHVFYERGEPVGLASAKPCRDPEKEYIGDNLYLPHDCGQCSSCLARAAIERRLDEDTTTEDR